MADVHGEFVKKQQQESSNDQMVTKVITGDGKELQLTAQQKEEIFSQLQDHQSSDLTNNVVMVLNNDSFEDDPTQIIQSDPNIMVVYSQANEIIKSTYIESTTTSIIETKIEDSQIVDALKEDVVMSTEIPTKEDSIDFDDKLNELLDENIESKDDEKKDDESSHKKNDADKLISALEGDWSEDEEEETTDIKIDKEIVKEADVQVKEEENNVEELVNEKETEESKEIETKLEENVPDKNDDKKELPNIMEDWIESESQKSFSEELSESKEIESTSTNNTVENKKTDSTELKTLINDWGDDDDDL